MLVSTIFGNLVWLLATNFVTKKMLGHKILLPRTSMATSSKDLVPEKVPRHKILLSTMTSVTSYLSLRKFLTTKFDAQVCPW